MDVEMMKNENVENVEDTDVSEGKAKKKGKFLAVKIGGALVLLAAVSIGLLPGLVARFSSQDETGDNGRVATFNVTEEGTWTKEIQATVNPGENNITFTNKTGDKEPLIKITNSCEVAIAYSITITNVTKNIKKLKNTDDKYVWELSGELEPGKSYTADDTLNFLKWNSTDIKETDDNLEYMGRVDYFTVEVTATQINSYTDKKASATP
jgi:hypothetical protein